VTGPEIAALLMLSGLLGGTVGCGIVFLFARFTVAQGIAKMHREHEEGGRCPLCKRAGFEPA